MHVLVQCNMQCWEHTPTHYVNYTGVCVYIVMYCEHIGHVYCKLCMIST